MTKKPTLSEQVKAPADKARELLGGFYKTVDVMKSAYSKCDKKMSVWADDLYAVEAVMSFLESIRDGDQAMTWQPIETAPRDGRLAIVYRPLALKSGDQPVAVKRLIKGNHHCWDSTVPEGSKPFNPTDGSCHVTHWMPIPDPLEPTR